MKKKLIIAFVTVPETTYRLIYRFAMSAANDLELVRQHYAQVGRILERSSKSGFVSHDDMNYLSSEIAQLAKQLKDEEHDRIKDLVRNGPRVFYENGELNIVFLRGGKERFVRVGHNQILFMSTCDESIISLYGLDISDIEDEMHYYLKVVPFRGSPYGISVDMEEWKILKAMFCQEDS